MISPDLFLSASERLRGFGRRNDRNIDALLSALEYGPIDEFNRKHTDLTKLREHRAALLCVAAKLESVFQIDSATAPGLVFLGGVLRPRVAGVLHALAPAVNVSGKGQTMQQAFETCVGEAVEYLSQLEEEQDEFETVTDTEGLALLDERSRRNLEPLLCRRADTERSMEWSRVTRLSDGATVLLPVELCLRRPLERKALALPFLLGTGTAAGRCLDEAICHALLELIERDALGLWWKGGRRGREVDPALVDAGGLLGRLRQGRCDRTVRMLDITTDLGVPCLVAISCGAGGSEFAFGVAARMTTAAAARAAILEMCQIELAGEVVKAKMLKSGETALNNFDKAHLLRIDSINVEDCILLHPLRSAGCKPELQHIQSLSELIARVARCGIEVYCCNITRKSYGVPAVRLVAPELQLEPSGLTSPRLSAVLTETGGGEKFTGGIPIL